MSSRDTDTRYTDVLDEETLRLLGTSPPEGNASMAQMKRLRERVMQRVDDDSADASKSFITVRSDEGDWIQLTPKIRKKVLFLDATTGTESYLLKAEPGAAAPPHGHEHDEHCVVLEGEVTFGDSLHLKAGDYHFAPRGSAHGIARTDTGVTVYIQTSQHFAPAA